MLNTTTSASGISIKQTRYKEKIEGFFENTMNNEVKSDVRAFDTVIYNYAPVSSQSIVYQEYSTSKGIDLYDAVKELTGEILSRIESREVAIVE